MFVDLRHIPDDMESSDDDEDDHLEGDDGIMEFDWLINMGQNNFCMGAIIGSIDNKFINPNGKGSCTIGHYKVKDHK